ncbi:hypothetical protein AX16_009775 [Volvariella volvacea WC 439]|nr:hypothetical protein AX16_009775 [Volvariella volvacea WC 439]
MAYYIRSHLAFNANSTDEEDSNHEELGGPPPGYTSPVPPSLRPSYAPPSHAQRAESQAPVPAPGYNFPSLGIQTRSTQTVQQEENDNAHEADEEEGNLGGRGSDSDASLPVPVADYLDFGTVEGHSPGRADDDDGLPGGNVPSYRSIVSSRRSERGHEHRQGADAVDANPAPAYDSQPPNPRTSGRTGSLRSHRSRASRRYRHSHTGHAGAAGGGLVTTPSTPQRKSQHRRHNSQPQNTGACPLNEQGGDQMYSSSLAPSRTYLPMTRTAGQSVHSHETHLLPPPPPPLPPLPVFSPSDFSGQTCALTPKPIVPLVGGSQSSTKLSPTNHVSLSRKTRRDAKGFSLRKISASIKGTFTVNPYLHIPLALLGEASGTVNADGNNNENGNGKRKNLLLQVENGGIDVDIVLVGQGESEHGRKVEKTSLELKLVRGTSNDSRMHPLVARVHTPDSVRPPFHLRMSGVDGYVAAHLPASFQGLVTVRVEDGNLNGHISLSRKFEDGSTIMSEMSTTRSFFLGELGGWSNNDENWAGDSVEVSVHKGKVRLQLAGEKDWDGFRRLRWRVFGF